MNEEIYKEIWDEICFILSENINSNTNEKEFESQIVRAIESLGWKEYKKEVVRQLSVQIGRQGSLRPDIVIYGENNKALVVIEVKNPLESISNKESIGQLKSYMRQLKSEFGWLLANEIAIYYDGNKNPHSEPLLIDRLQFNKNSQAGIKFVEMFQKNNFLEEKYNDYLQNKIKNFNKQREIRNLKNVILSEDTKEKIIKFLEKEHADYGMDIFASVLEDITIEIREKKKELPKEIVSPQPETQKKKKYHSPKPQNESGQNIIFSGKTYSIQELENMYLGKEVRPAALEIENDRFEVKNWTELICKFVEWLINNNKLRSSHLPLLNHAERDKFFINNRSEHKDPRKDAQWQSVGSYFVDTKYNAEAHKKNIVHTLYQLDLRNVLNLRISFK